MTEGYLSKDDIVHMGDRTAIIAAGIAMGVTLISAPGFYGILTVIVASCITIWHLSYEYNRETTARYY